MRGVTRIDVGQLVHQLRTADPDTVAGLVATARRSDDPAVLIAASLFAVDGDVLVGRARDLAASTHDRQLVAIAEAHRRGDDELVDALARDHLVDHPDSVLVASIAAARRSALPNSDPNPTLEAP